MTVDHPHIAREPSHACRPETHIVRRPMSLPYPLFMPHRSCSGCGALLAGHCSAGRLSSALSSVAARPFLWEPLFGARVSVRPYFTGPISWVLAVLGWRLSVFGGPYSVAYSSGQALCYPVCRSPLPAYAAFAEISGLLCVEARVGPNSYCAPVGDLKIKEPPVCRPKLWLGASGVWLWTSWLALWVEFGK